MKPTLVKSFEWLTISKVKDCLNAVWNIMDRYLLQKKIIGKIGLFLYFGCNYGMILCVNHQIR